MPRNIFWMRGKIVSELQTGHQTVTVYVTGKKSVVEGRTDIAVEADPDTRDRQHGYGSGICTGYAEVCHRNFGKDVIIIPKSDPVTIERLRRRDFK